MIPPRPEKIKLMQANQIVPLGDRSGKAQPKQVRHVVSKRSGLSSGGSAL